MIDALKKNDKVLTSGGIYGTVVSVDALSLTEGAFWPLLTGLILVLAPVAAIGAWEHGLIGAGIVMPVSSKVYTLVRAAFLSLVWLPFVRY